MDFSTENADLLQEVCRANGIPFREDERPRKHMLSILYLRAPSPKAPKRTHPDENTFKIAETKRLQRDAGQDTSWIADEVDSRWDLLCASLLDGKEIKIPLNIACSFTATDLKPYTVVLQSKEHMYLRPNSQTASGKQATSEDSRSLESLPLADATIDHEVHAAAGAEKSDVDKGDGGEGGDGECGSDV